jgi:glycosyltransferase involved in cell wall biosynthesis
VRTGIARSTGAVVVIQDADMEYDPTEVPELIRPIVEGYADVVYGSRLTGGRPQRAYMFWHLMGNRALALLTNVLWNTTLSDMETGYKAFRGEVVRDFELTEDDFRIEPEITANVLDRKLRLYQIPIAYYGRAYDEGKKIGWRDGPPAVWTLLRLRFGRGRRGGG